MRARSSQTRSRAFDAAKGDGGLLSALHVVASINDEVGGPARSVPGLAQGMAALDVRTAIATLDYRKHGSQPDGSGVTIVSVPATTVTRVFRGWSPPFRNALARLAAGGYDLVHNHGLWMAPNAYARQVASAAGIPLVISPRGMLDQWSLRRRRLLKRLAWMAYERANFDAAVILHATSMDEAESIRVAGLRHPIAIVPNGVEMPHAGHRPLPDLLLTLYPQLVGKRWMLFLSRLHPKKGIADLLQAWSKVSAEFPDWHLIVAGPDLDGHRPALERECRALGVASAVTFTGMLHGDEKACAYANARLFVLPTYSENFGAAIAEALSYGVPVITTTAAPWACLTEIQGGWRIAPGAAPLGATLQDALRLPDDVLADMGMRGRDWLEAHISWSATSTTMKAVYEWVCGCGERPDCVVTA